MSEKQKEIANKLRGILINNLRLSMNEDEITYDIQLFEKGLGLDSVDALEIVAAVDDEYGLSLTTEDREYFENIRTLSGLILCRLEGKNE